MNKYEVICESLQEQVDAGVLRLEDANIINELAYDKYVEEKTIFSKEIYAKKGSHANFLSHGHKIDLAITSNLTKEKFDSVYNKVNKCLNLITPNMIDTYVNKKFKDNGYDIPTASEFPIIGVSTQSNRPTHLVMVFDNKRKDFIDGKGIFVHFDFKFNLKGDLKPEITKVSVCFDDLKYAKNFFK